MVLTVGLHRRNCCRNHCHKLCRRHCGCGGGSGVTMLGSGRVHWRKGGVCNGPVGQWGEESQT